MSDKKSARRIPRSGSNEKKLFSIENINDRAQHLILGPDDRQIRLIVPPGRDGLRDFFVGMCTHVEGEFETGRQTAGVVFFH